MKRVDLEAITKVSYNQVGMYGKDAATVYRAIVELDRKVTLWRERALEKGWTDEQDQ